MMASLGFSQNAVQGKTVSKSAEEIYTPLKPKDASPAVFGSKSDLEAKRQRKIDATLELIKKNKDNPELVIRYRE